MSTFSSRLRGLRKEQSLTQAELAKIFNVAKSTISMYECGEREPSFEQLKEFADFFQVDTEYLLGRSEWRTNDDYAQTAAELAGPVLDHFNGDVSKALAFQRAVADDALAAAASLDFSQLPSNVRPVKPYRVPLVGTIAAGLPMYAEQDFESSVLVDADIRCDCALSIQGDSMIDAGISDGDVVLIRLQPDVDDGQIAAVIIDDTATLKRVYHQPTGVMLVSANPAYPPQIYTPENSTSIRILGRAVYCMSLIR